MVTLEDLKKLNHKELGEELERARINLLKLRLDLGAKQSTETGKVKKLRRYIARIKTLKHMRELEVSVPEIAPENAKSASTK